MPAYSYAKALVDALLAFGASEHEQPRKQK